MNKVRESSELDWSREKELDSSRIKGDGCILKRDESLRGDTSLLVLKDEKYYGLAEDSSGLVRDGACRSYFFLLRGMGAPLWPRSITR